MLGGAPSFRIEKKGGRPTLPKIPRIKRLEATSFRCQCGRKSPVPMHIGEWKDLIAAVSELRSRFDRFEPYVDSRFDELEFHFESILDELESDLESKSKRD